ncbi:hypothetical protein HOP62_07565 [Halomonas sp. MCCC 1A17488]|uniref:hypothetical protein n=1 Tax=unclassified Halomonas TaxID=2609666 RepID=UPI0018D27249|nr:MULTISPECIES: hypothetical protein [unclassified Halomonas]MCE8015931.1 hypothetical protein [Halomonas sp. MCCC 1A17488]MCG3239264.1 hypothetical protein [Halomonas sp. MCCC 1A17488]QPP50803.1 hypothetical protein I4484_06820 [Halomonas sp. SS10-MC5]
MELFVLSKEAPRIRKVILQREAQVELEETGKTQIDNFMSFEECYELSAQYKPDPHESFVINDFEDIDGVIDAIKEPAGVPPWKPNEEDIEISGFFFGIEENNKYKVGLQIFDKRQVISNKFTLTWSRESFTHIKGLSLSLDNKLTAVVSEEENGLALYFKSLHNVRRLFDMDMYFREATKQDVDDFFESEIFLGYDPEDPKGLIDTWCRKKIAYILSEDRIGQLTATSVKIKAEELNVSIDIIKDENNEDKISFPEDKKSLKRLLRFLDEDIYKSSLSNTIFVASGKRKD